MRLVLSGDLDANSVPALWRRYGEIGAISAIDLSAVGRIDSAGVALIRVLQQRSHDAGQEAALEHLPVHYTQLAAAHRLQPVGATRE